MSIHYPDFPDPFDQRMAYEHQLVDEFCEYSPLVTYEANKRRGGLPPTRYVVHYHVRSIIGIDADRMPIYGHEHTAEIVVRPGYPLAVQPKCTMLTPVWHPNIKYDGNFVGKICVNEEALGSWHTLDMMIQRIGEILQYKNYHALPILPHPEDARVAAWVREFAEPRGIVNKNLGLVTDNRELCDPSPEWLESRRRKRAIFVSNPRPLSAEEREETERELENAAPARKTIVVKLREEDLL
jgi:hypothetical protein